MAYKKWWQFRKTRGEWFLFSDLMMLEEFGFCGFSNKIYFLIGFSSPWKNEWDNTLNAGKHFFLLINLNSFYSRDVYFWHATLNFWNPLMYASQKNKVINMCCLVVVCSCVSVCEGKRKFAQDHTECLSVFVCNHAAVYMRVYEYTNSIENGTQ